jgi:hypothetical protein
VFVQDSKKKYADAIGHPSPQVLNSVGIRSVKFSKFGYMKEKPPISVKWRDTYLLVALVYYPQQLTRTKCVTQRKNEKLRKDQAVDRHPRHAPCAAGEIHAVTLRR